MPTITKGLELQGMLKEVCPKLMENTIVKRTEVLDIFTERSAQSFEGPEGKYWKLSNLIGGYQGIGSRNENSFLPAGGTPILINPLVQQKYHYVRIDITYQAMRNAAGGEAAFSDFATGILLPNTENLTDDLDRQACGYGSGILARVDEASPDLTLQIDAPFGVANDTKGWLNVKTGMKIVFGPNPDGSGLRDGGTPATVLTVDPTGNAGGGIALLDVLPSGVLDNDFIFRGDEQGANIPIGGVEPEMMGLHGIVDDGTTLDTLENISRTDVYEWKATRINAGAAPYSGAFTDGLAMRMVTDARTIGGGKLDLIVGSHDVARQAFNAVRGLGGFAANRDGSTVRMGAKGILVDTPMGTIEIRGVSRIVPGVAYGLDTSTLGMAKDGSIEWVDQWGGSIFHQMQNGSAIKDAGFLYARACKQVFCSNPQRNVQSYGISETAY